MLKTADLKHPPSGSTHKLTITNEKTGKVELEVTNCHGGLFIVHDDEGGELATRQAGFGTPASIVLCALKVGPVINQMLKQSEDLKKIWDVAKSLAGDAGLDTTGVE